MPKANGKEGATNDSVTTTTPIDRFLTRIVAALADLRDGINTPPPADARESTRWEIADMPRVEPESWLTALTMPTSGDADSDQDAGVMTLDDMVERWKNALHRASADADSDGDVSLFSFVIARAARERLLSFQLISRDDATAAAGYEEYGSSEGPAETLDARAEPYFTVRDALTGIAVRCYFGEREREDAARAVAGKRIVSVEGMLHRDREGRTRRIDPVHSIAVIDEPPQGDLDALSGIFSGIGDTQAYLRKIRGE